MKLRFRTLCVSLLNTHLRPDWYPAESLAYLHSMLSATSPLPHRSFRNTDGSWCHHRSAVVLYKPRYASLHEAPTKGIATNGAKTLVLILICRWCRLRLSLIWGRISIPWSCRRRHSRTQCACLATIWMKLRSIEVFGLDLAIL